MPRLRRFCGFPVSGLLGAALLAAGCAQGAPRLPEEIATSRGGDLLEPLPALTVSIVMLPTATTEPTITASPLPAATVNEDTSPTPTRTPELTALITPEPVAAAASPQASPARSITDALTSLCWVAFSPTNQDPEKGIAPGDEGLREDLRALRAAGFDGLVTYGSEARVYRFAPEIGFKAMIMGIWDPRSEAELAIAEEAGRSDFVAGFVVGNEGLHRRYEIGDLTAAMDRLRRSTGKPVTTTEESSDYGRDPALAGLGDWVYPNVHPYFQHKTDPAEAVAWTAQIFDRFAGLSGGRAVMFKEAGLPTDGDEDVDEGKQADYYRLLQETPVRFVYFEAFDQPWKDDLPVEPHWGLYRSDRSAKPVVEHVCGRGR
jgi:exo-beta-1,3-glucanase (GH17 family)